MADPNPKAEPTLLSILATLTLGQAWTLGATAVGVLVGATALGAWVQGARDDEKIMEKNRTQIEQQAKYEQLKRDTDNTGQAMCV